MRQTKNFPHAVAESTVEMAPGALTTNGEKMCAVNFPSATASVLLYSCSGTAQLTKEGSMSKDNSLTHALERVRTALAAMGSGDPEPYIDCWAASDDATLFGAWGPIEKGYPRLAETFRWVGGRFKGGPLVPENTVVFTSGDLAYTVGFERGEVMIDGGAKHPMTIRVTHIYRRFGEEWQLVHRHADFPPQDQRRTANAA